jgi:hypothetical protein
MENEKKHKFTPEQMAYLKEKVKIARERAGSQKQAERRLSDFKMGVAKKRARVESRLDFRKPSKAQLFSSGLDIAGKTGKGIRSWAKSRGKRKANHFESHYAAINKRMWGK